MPQTLQEILNATIIFLEKKGVESPRLDAELLLGKGLGLSRVSLYVQFDRPLLEEELNTIRPLVQRRGNREPLAYILGEKEFYSLKFKVTPDVLIPRPETEELVEMGVEHFKAICESVGAIPTWLPAPTKIPNILDLATGTGCILISLLKNIPTARGVGVELNFRALEVARTNAKNLGVEERVNWVGHDLQKPWPSELKGPFDLITANPPYVSEEEWKELEPEVRDHEPREALVPGTHASARGIEAFEWVLPKIPSRLDKGGIALLEMGIDQGETLLQMAQKLTPALQPKILLDLSKHPRFLRLTHRS
jgi:release factor glutamine methyltransferase